VVFLLGAPMLNPIGRTRLLTDSRRISGLQIREQALCALDGLLALLERNCEIQIAACRPQGSKTEMRVLKMLDLQS
jgi:hypothetical protein